MKYLHLILILWLSLGCSGCTLICGVPPEAKTTASENAQLSDGFVTMMDAGTTSRVQEQGFIRALRRAWHAQDYALNDEPLPRDVDIWFKRRKLGIENNALKVPARNNNR